MQDVVGVYQQHSPTDSITRKHKNNGGLRFFGDVRTLGTSMVCL